MATLTLVPPASQSPVADRGLWSQQGQASLIVEQMAKLLFAAQASHLEVAPLPEGNDLSPTVRDTYRQHAEIAILKLDPTVSVRVQSTLHRQFGDVGLGAVRAFDRTLLAAAPRLSAISGGSVRA